MRYLKQYTLHITLLAALLSIFIMGIDVINERIKDINMQPALKTQSTIVGEMNAMPASPGHGPGKQFNPPNTGQRMEPFNGGGGGSRESNSGDAQYAPLSVAYALVFLVLAAAACCLYRLKKVKINLQNSRVLIFALFGTGLLLRYYLSTYVTGHPFDLNLFKNWASAASNNLLQFYSHTRCDYPPLYIYVLALIGKIAAWPSLNKVLYDIVVKEKVYFLPGSNP